MRAGDSWLERLHRIGVFTTSLGRASMPMDAYRTYLGGLADLGYSSLWFSEAFGREALTNAALALSQAPTLTVGTGIANIWGRDATAMANGARTLGEAFPARFVLGIGVGSERMVGPRGHRYDRPLATLRTYLHDMGRARWDGPPVPEPVPTVIGALGPRALALTYEAADGAQTAHSLPSHTTLARELLGPDKGLVVVLTVVVNADRSAARRIARDHLAFYLGLPNWRTHFLRQGFTDLDLDDGGSDRLVDEVVCWGEPTTILRRIHEHLEAGADQVAIQVEPSLTARSQLAALKMLAPHLGDLFEQRARGPFRRKPV